MEPSLRPNRIDDVVVLKYSDSDQQRLGDCM